MTISELVFFHLLPGGKNMSFISSVLYRNCVEPSKADSKMYMGVWFVFKLLLKYQLGKSKLQDDHMGG